MKNSGKLMILMLMLLVGASVVSAQDWAGDVERVEHRGRDRGYREIKPMKSGDFKKFCRYVKDTSFDKNKIHIVEIATFGSYFSSEQCYKILSLFSFDDNKLAVLRILKPVILDYNCAEKILSSFSFSSKREKAAAILLRGMSR